MNWPESSSSSTTPPPGRRGVTLQGPRPSPLSINKDSRKIGKTASASKPPLPARPSRAPDTDTDAHNHNHNREPVVIYAVSPKAIHIDASDFKSVVQRLTGRAPPTPSDGGPVSPAARLAALDRISPTGRERERERSNAKNETELMEMNMMLEWEAGMLDLGQMPGILSPAPDNLPALPAAIFSDFGFQESLMSPFLPGSCFLPSPGSGPSSSGLFTGALNFSPSPSPVFDFSTIFDSSY